MKYLTFIRASEKYGQSGPPAAALEAVETFMTKLSEDGALVDRGALLPSKDGLVVRLANGKITVIDGPFAESKEVIGGWAIIKADSKQDMTRMATEAMELHRIHWPEFQGECEVRPMYEPD